MSETYKDFAREPSKPHQCMHCSEKDGTRCRAIAMHNEYMCYHHRCDDIPTVIQNDPFLIEDLSDHDAIQKALADVAARLACNHMDFKRAALLLQSLQIASSNLAAKSRLLATPPPAPPHSTTPQPVIPSQAVSPINSAEAEKLAPVPVLIMQNTTPQPAIPSEAHNNPIDPAPQPEQVPPIPGSHEASASDPCANPASSARAATTYTRTGRRPGRRPSHGAERACSVRSQVS